MANIRQAIAAGLLNGLGEGLKATSNVYANQYEDQNALNVALARDQLERSNLEKEYNFIEGLDEDAQDRALKIKSAGNLTLDPKTGKYIKYKSPSGSKKGSPDSTTSSALSLWK